MKHSCANDTNHFRLTINAFPVGNFSNWQNRPPTLFSSPHILSMPLSISSSSLIKYSPFSFMSMSLCALLGHTHTHTSTVKILVAWVQFEAIPQWTYIAPFHELCEVPFIHLCWLLLYCCATERILFTLYYSFSCIQNCFLYIKTWELYDVSMLYASHYNTQLKAC